MASDESTKEKVEQSVCKLLAYCEANSWAGYEPYDALNSPIFEKCSWLDSRLPRLALTQLLKRSPINFRGPLRIAKTQNPKALGLFLSALVKLDRLGISCSRQHAQAMVEKLKALRSASHDYWCWGYNFPWQTRTVLVPRWEPNLVCTTFAAFGLLDAFKLTGDERLLEMGLSAARFVLDELYWTEDGPRCGFDYPLPHVRHQVHNANLLASDLLIRAYQYTGNEQFLDPALKATRYTVSQQHADGGWDYGEAASQKWIDNFHTGFNLSALHSISKNLGSSEFFPSIGRGLKFYRSHFFRNDGAVGYFHDRRYPLDSHCVAQSIITLLDLKELGSDHVRLAKQVFDWAYEQMWNGEQGFFYYRQLRSCTNRISYMRWTQAWMLLALTRLWSELVNQGGEICAPEITASEVV